MNNKNSKYFEAFQDSITSVWSKKLCYEFIKIAADVQQVLGQTLKTPMFRLNHSTSELGSWNAAESTLTISFYALDNYEWDVVVHILKHEMAHMIVSEIWGDIDTNGRAHGELFAKACDVLGIAAHRTFDPAHDCVEKEKLVSRVQKLFALGESNFKEEADLAIKKAYELMARHNIVAAQLQDMERRFVARPVGDLYLKMPFYIKKLAWLVRKHYFVECIINFLSVGGKHYNFIEFFGEPHNVDVAEYVYHFLLLEGERHWQSFSVVKASRDYTKSAFLEGFYSGFAVSLQAERESVMAVVDPGNTLPIGIADPLLVEKYRGHYPSLRKRKGTSGSKKLGKQAGFERGQRVTIRQGVTTTSGSEKKRLT